MSANRKFTVELTFSECMVAYESLKREFEKLAERHGDRFYALTPEAKENCVAVSGQLLSAAAAINEAVPDDYMAGNGHTKASYITPFCGVAVPGGK